VGTYQADDGDGGVEQVLVVGSIASQAHKEHLDHHLARPQEREEPLAKVPVPLRGQDLGEAHHLCSIFILFPILNGK